MIAVSSCLAGIECRYNGSHSLVEKIKDLVEQNRALLICPELLGGFSTPRESAEIVDGTGEDVLDGNAKVIEKSGNDVTKLYIKGAYKALSIIQEVNVRYVVLKENSPSCGSSIIYNGEFANTKIAGEGVTAALFRRAGIKVISEEQFLNTNFF
ncbi:DUF523 domain-containing protein [Priestia megaterium]|uniref:DUF523 domain-containing protein n=1 Tax=Priestia megaterium TaxID=1404 RepID=UPI0023DA9FB5|nr:DUF523 domain-containing protein [Priestia megaterium]MDF2014242.1 DUF523 domain-containing protein [Priestia megaterium]MDF2052841.1 DUF523 domain-containing protein [Priestia megaterium]MDF2060807.1 DUF523 domain-containing protein [Priestia megaterium]